MSASTNLKKLDCISYQQILIMGSCKLLHKIILNHKPKALLQYISQGMLLIDNTRRVRNSFIKRASLTDKTGKSFLYRRINIYNLLPNQIKAMEPKKFNKTIKSIIRTNISPDRVP